MCLIDKKKFRFTILPKIVYKKFLYFSDEKKLKNYCQLTEVTSRILIPDSYDEPEYNSIFKDYEFGNGFYHACLTREKAYSLALTFGDSATVKVVEGYIPAFTRYALDIDGVSVCARKMILNI